MGKHDNRKSPKMRRRESQKKYKARLKRQKAASKALRAKPVSTKKSK